MPAEQSVNILLVDDRSENLLALEAMLEPLGQNLVRARSGDEALKCLLRQDFAVILLDVQMPGLDGFETATLIRGRERSADTPIIFLTAINTSDMHISRGYAVGAVDYLLKPITFDRFLKAVDKANQRITQPSVPGQPAVIPKAVDYVFVKDGTKLVKVNYDDIMKGYRGEPTLKPGDVVEVPGRKGGVNRQTQFIIGAAIIFFLFR